MHLCIIIHGKNMDFVYRNQFFIRIKIGIINAIFAEFIVINVGIISLKMDACLIARKLVAFALQCFKTH